MRYVWMGAMAPVQCANLSNVRSHSLSQRIDQKASDDQGENDPPEASKRTAPELLACGGVPFREKRPAITHRVIVAGVCGKGTPPGPVCGNAP
jgi:hypothetical protein